MPPPVFKIDKFQFVSMEGNVDSLVSQLETVERAGVDGTAFWDTGERGRGFQLTTGVDVETWPTVFTRYRDYRALIKADPVEIVWSDLDLADLDSVLFQVTNVQVVDRYKLGPSCGGLAAPSVAWLSCVWTLVPVRKVS